MRRVKDGITKAQRYNRNMENIFAYAEKVNKNRMNWLRQQGVSEDEIQEAKANTGLGKDGLGRLVLEVARGKGDKRLNSDIFREVDDLEAIRNVKDGCGRKVKDENQIGWLKGKSNFVLHLQGKTGNVTSLKYEQTIPFESGYGDVYTMDVDGKVWLTSYMVYNNQLYREVASAKQVDWIKENGFSKWWVDNSISDSGRKVKDGYSKNSDYFGDWYGKGQIDFDAIINPEDDGDLYMVKIWGGSGYVLDVYLVKAYSWDEAIDIVFDWSYENEGANNIIFDYEYLSKRCHEDYEIEYWYGKGNGKPSDTMSYDEFEEEWMGGYIPNSNYDLFAIDENFFIDKVPQDMVE